MNLLGENLIGSILFFCSLFVLLITFFYFFSCLDHPNIVHLYGVTPSPPRLVMELLLGDLCSLMIHPIDPNNPNERIEVSPDTYSWKLRLRIAFDVAKGMQYLQNISPPIIHRDLRSPNIFVS